MSGKRYKKGNEKPKEKEKSRKIIVTIVLFIFIAIMIFSGIKIFNWLKENKHNRDIIEDISNTVTIDENLDNKDKYNVDFESLK